MRARAQVVDAETMEWKPASRAAGYEAFDISGAIWFIHGRRKGTKIDEIYFDVGRYYRAFCRYRAKDGDVDAFFKGLSLIPSNSLKLCIRKGKFLAHVAGIHTVMMQMMPGDADHGFRARCLLEFNEAEREERRHRDTFDFGDESDSDYVAPLHGNANDNNAPPPELDNASIERRMSLRPKRSRIPRKFLEDDDDDDDDDDDEEAKSISLVDSPVRRSSARASAAKKKGKTHDGAAIASQVAEKYGGGGEEQPQTVYANSQEELVADAGRLVLLNPDPTLVLSDSDQGDFDPEIDPAEAEKHKQFLLRSLAVRDRSIKELERLGIRRRPSPTPAQRYASRHHQVEQVDDEDEDEDDYVNDEREGEQLVHEEVSSVSDMSLMIAANINALVGLQKLATYIHERHSGINGNRDTDMQRHLKLVETSMMELSRTIQSQVPLDSSKGKRISHVVIDPADGTEVRQNETAAELGIVWSAIDESVRRRVSERARDLHKEIYGAYPKKVNMPYSGGKRPVYYYNRETSEKTVKVAMRELILEPKQ